MYKKNKFYGYVLPNSGRLFTASLYMHAKEKVSEARGGGRWGLRAKQARQVKEE